MALFDAINLILPCIYVLFARLIRVQKKSQNKLILILYSLQIIIIVGTRTFNTGADTPAYYQFYQIAGTKGMEERALGYFEPLFSLVGVLCARLNLSFTLFNILIAGLTMLFFSAAVIKLNADAFLCVYLYTLFCCHLNMMNQVRQALAMMIVFYAITFLSENKKIKFAILVILAALIHISSLIAFVLLPIWNIKINKKMIFIYFSSGLIFILFYNTIIGFVVNYFDYGHYLTETWRYGLKDINAILNFIVRIIILIFSMVFYRELSKKYKNIYGYYHMAFICTLLQLLCIFNNAFGRITTLFFYTYIYLIPTILNDTLLFKKNKIIMNIAMFLASLIYYCIYLNSKGSEYHSVISNVF